MDIKRHALFTHCYDHTLDLSYSDAVKGWKLSRLLQKQQTKLIKFSPSKEAMSQEMKKSVPAEIVTPGIHLLCPTHWTVQGHRLT